MALEGAPRSVRSHGSGPAPSQPNAGVRPRHRLLLMHSDMVLLALLLLVSRQSGCRRALPITPPVAPDVTGRVLGQSDERTPGGLGGIARVTVTLSSDQARACSRAHLWVDSLTRLEGRA